MLLSTSSAMIREPRFGSGAERRAFLGGLRDFPPLAISFPSSPTCPIER